MSVASTRFYSHTNFGQRFAGATTIGYTVKNPLTDAVILARSTSVIEYTVGAGNTGIFAAEFQVPNPKTEVAVVWDTGAHQPKTEYAIDHNASRWYRVEKLVEKVPIIHNTLRNKSNFEATVLRELADRNGVEFTEDVHLLTLTQEELCQQEKGLGKESHHLMFPSY